MIDISCERYFIYTIAPCVKTIQVVSAGFRFTCAVINSPSIPLICGGSWFMKQYFTYERYRTYILHSLSPFPILNLDTDLFVNSFFKLIIKALCVYSQYVISSMLAMIVSTSFGVRVYNSRLKLPALQISTYIYKMTNLNRISSLKLTAF